MKIMLKNTIQHKKNMIYTIKEDKFCIKTRSTSASFAPAIVKCPVENNNSNNEINI